MSRAAQAEEMFMAALDCAPEERDDFIAGACAGDDALGDAVRTLLALHRKADDFMGDSPASPEVEIEADLARLNPEKEGERIGRYKLLQQIGEGGFGTVWMAEQMEPVSRKVALKIIKLGMDTKEVIARFEAERQALAMMDDPNIAKVFDAGATQWGRPYFVMELVRGIPITQYCDEAGLGTVERLTLFRDVCSAINHAHQKGVIHRDIKPSNVMITLHGDKPVVKVIDFGIAKATQGKLTDKTLFTRFEQFVGTPVYMSPEQATMSGLDVDTRSDIYALGILLYELLTGKPPFDPHTLASAGYEEMRRIIREVEPPKPSSRISTMAGDERTLLAKARHMEPEKLSRLVEPDLDWIVMKAIDKDRTRRYETANGLAADIQRFLADELVSARPPSAGYQFQKFARRNKAALRVAAGIAAVLVAATLVSTWQAVRADREAKRAVAAFDELRATAPAFVEQARSLADKERFDEAIEKLDYALKLRPGEAEFLMAKGDLLRCQLKLTEAAAIYREALRVKPGLARAEASAKLCDELSAAPGENRNLTRESLAKLHHAMQQQQRPAAELMPVARLLGEEKKLIVDYWLARLKDLPVSAEFPLSKRLTVRDDGRLALDLSKSQVLDLSPLAGAPLAALDVSRSTELTDLSPLSGLALIELNIGDTSVSDLTALREMHTLEKLEMTGTKVADLTALGALRLKILNFGGCPVSDLNPIRRMPLETINLGYTRVANLSPLIGMPIKSINLSYAPVLDFSPLAQLPLERCFFQGSRITDLAVLRGKPLIELGLLGCVDARNYQVLSEIKTLELLLLPTTYWDLPAADYEAIGSLRDHPKLRQLGAEFMDGMTTTATGPKELFWQAWDREQTFVPALRAEGLKFTLTKLPSGTYSLLMQNQPLRDLAILKGAPISELTLFNCPISDLTPIHNLKLEALRLDADFVADLDPLRGMPLKTFSLTSSKVTDVSPLAGLPLRELYLEGCRNVNDVAALAEISTLEKLTVPAQAGNIETLRKMPGLQMLAFNRVGATARPDSTVAEFWKDYGWIRRLHEAGIKPKILVRLDDGTWQVHLDTKPAVDLTILEGAPISILSLVGTPDLTPLRGMALKKLWLTGTGVTDLGPLKGMLLEFLSLSSNNKVTDLSVLRGMPLVELRLRECFGITDLSPLEGSKTLQLLILPSNAKNFEFLRTFPELERISFNDDPKNNFRPDKTAAEFWEESGQKWALALRNAGMNYTASQDAAGMWSVTVTSKEFSDCTVFIREPIRELGLFETSVTDLRPLEDLPLTSLDIRKTPVTDLAPLRAPVLSANLKKLDLWYVRATDFSALAACHHLEGLDAANTRLADLEILRGHPLKIAIFANTRVTDISPLAGMPLDRLALNSTPVTDLSPLLKCPNLAQLVLPSGAHNVGILRSLPALTALSYDEISGGFPTRSAAKFWQEYDAGKK